MVCQSYDRQSGRGRVVKAAIKSSHGLHSSQMLAVSTFWTVVNFLD